MNDARMMFSDARVALGVSYGMSARVAQLPCSLRHALIEMMQGAHLTNARQRDWYARLLGTPSAHVNLAGLTPFERHAQCAMIRRAVDNLPAPQAYAIMTAFTQAADEREVGINGLTEHVCSCVRFCRDPASVREIIERRYTPPRMRDGHSLRDIAARTGVSKSHLARIAHYVDHECRALEAEAISALEKLFITQGMCDPVFRIR
jgi:uncharacterized protein YerC